MTDLILTPYALASSLLRYFYRNHNPGMQRRSVRAELLFSCFSWRFLNGLSATGWKRGGGSGFENIIFQDVYVGAQSAPVFLLLFALKFSGRVERIQPISVTGFF
jgi:hypothetical protein